MFTESKQTKISAWVCRGSGIDQELLFCSINGLNLLTYWQGALFLASQDGFCTGSRTLASFPGWVVVLVKKFVIAAVCRANQELQLCSHEHLGNSKEEFEPEGRLVSSAPLLLNLLFKELIGNRCTYPPFCFSWSILFFSSRIFPVISPGCWSSPVLWVSILWGIQRLWKLSLV